MVTGSLSPLAIARPWSPSVAPIVEGIIEEASEISGGQATSDDRFIGTRPHAAADLDGIPNRIDDRMQADSALKLDPNRCVPAFGAGPDESVQTPVEPNPSAPRVVSDASNTSDS